MGGVAYFGQCVMPPSDGKLSSVVSFCASPCTLALWLARV